MATFTLTDARVEVNGVDLSAWCSEVTLTTSYDEAEDTHFGDTWHGRIVGLGDWSVTATFSQDFAASAVDQTIGTAAMARSPITVKVRPTSAAISATNPQYSGPTIITEYNPIAGAVGDKATADVTFTGAGPLTRATA